MKKRTMLLLLILTIVFAGNITLADKGTDNKNTIITKEDILSAEELKQVMADQDEETAFLSWAKTCSFKIVDMKNMAIDFATSVHDYAAGINNIDAAANVAAIKSIINADNIWNIDVPIARDSKNAPLSVLKKIVTDYSKMKEYDTELSELTALKPAEPEEYKKTADWILKAAGKLHECLDVIDTWSKKDNNRSTMDLWKDMEQKYWDESLNTISGILFICWDAGQ